MDIVITRNEAIDRICIVRRGEHFPTEMKGNVKLGDAARVIAARNPDARIGILSWTNNLRASFGDIIWLKI